jgi:hypothetical protein
MVLLSGSAPILAQPPAPLDHKDPVAVAKAYVEACRTGDLQTVLSLLAPDDPVRGLMASAVQNVGGGMEQQGFTMQAIITEFLFLPLKLSFDAQPGASDVQGDTATVHFSRTLPIDQRVVLQRVADGTWQVKPVASVKATTGGKSTFLEMQAGTGGGGGDSGAWASQERLRTLHGALEEYARDHGNAYPPAGQWVDAIEPYVLDREAFKSPAALDLDYGYAMNTALGEQPVSNDWQVKRRSLLLFEWPGGRRNATAMPEELAKATSFRPDKTIAVIDASGNGRTLREGMAFEQAVEAEEQQSTCYDHLRKLGEAARRYARDNGGVLPKAGTWQDDLAVYLLDDPAAADLYRCPAAPDLDCAYAINEQVAGKNALELRGHGSTVLFFESRLNVPNATGLPERDAPTEGRHVDPWSGRRLTLAVFLNGRTGSLP